MKLRGLGVSKTSSADKRWDGNLIHAFRLILFFSPTFSRLLEQSVVKEGRKGRRETIILQGYIRAPALAPVVFSTAGRCARSFLFSPSTAFHQGNPALLRLSILQA